MSRNSDKFLSAFKVFNLFISQKNEHLGCKLYVGSCEWLIRCPARQTAV
jgi:hypothetical protein